MNIKKYNTFVIQMIRCLTFESTTLLLEIEVRLHHNDYFIIIKLRW